MMIQTVRHIKKKTNHISTRASIKVLLLLKHLAPVLILFFISCSPIEKKELQRGDHEVESKNFRIAINHYENVLKFSPTSKEAVLAAREAARVSHFELKNFEKAVVFYRHLVLYSENSDERIRSQKEISYIYFDNLQNYKQATTEFYKLLQMTENESEIAKYKLSIARANYYMNNFEQALSEINEISRMKAPDDVKFDMLILSGNILVAQKKFQKAAAIFIELMKIFPDKSLKENVGLTLAVCYEENQQYKEAIEILETLRATYKPQEYIELRVKKLKERMKNQPGAKGLHRK